nr:MAG TPA: hypothetical protein [Caudoviricetes sp.]
MKELPVLCSLLGYLIPHQGGSFVKELLKVSFLEPSALKELTVFSELRIVVALTVIELTGVFLKQFIHTCFKVIATSIGVLHAHPDKVTQLLHVVRSVGALLDKLLELFNNTLDIQDCAILVQQGVLPLVISTVCLQKPVRELLLEISDKLFGLIFHSILHFILYPLSLTFPFYAVFNRFVAEYANKYH